MRDKWYGDNRDLVKWGVLLELSRGFGCSHILQVLYYRLGAWASIQVDGQEIELCPDVIRHFRDVSGITRLRNSLMIEVVTDEFQDRKSYLKSVCLKISSRKLQPGIIFLDPDTGLQPAGKAGFEHVLNNELLDIWKCLKSGDVLVFYQHKTNRNGTEWVIPKKEQFEDALQVKRGSAKIASAPNIANDVVFFYIAK